MGRFNEFMLAIYDCDLNVVQSLILYSEISVVPYHEFWITNIQKQYDTFTLFGDESLFLNRFFLWVCSLSKVLFCNRTYVLHCHSKKDPPIWSPLFWGKQVRVIV